VSDDARGWRIALVPDVLVNAPQGREGGPDVMRVLEEQGYGVLHLPPTAGIGDPALLLAVIADQVAEYAHHGYAVVAVGAPDVVDHGLHWTRLSALLRHRRTPLPPCHVIGTEDAAEEEQRLTAFLAGYDIPEDEQRRWRV
jgi:hypothetical protein